MAEKAAKKKAVKRKPVKRSIKKKAKKSTKKTPTQKKKAKATAARSQITRKRRGTRETRKPPDSQFPNRIGLVSQHVDFLTYKVEQVRKFYGDLLGFRTGRQQSDLKYLIIHVTPNSSLGFMPPHPHMTGEQPPPREPTLYFVVNDVDKVFATLMAKGVAFMGPPQEMPWGHRVVMTTDPEGRTVMLGSEGSKK